MTDLVCSCGVHDRVDDETHGAVTVALVLAGGFRYRSSVGSADLSAGSTLVGTPGRSYACAHVHGEGDRCLAVQIEPAAFAGFLETRRRGVDGLVSQTCAVPAQRATTGLFAEAERLLLANSAVGSWAPFAGWVVDTALDAISGAPAAPLGPGDATDRRLADLVRALDAAPHAAPDVATMASHAGVSVFHFVRRFRAFTGCTPHAYVRRARIRDAALHLRTRDTTIARIALDSGFDDLSTFNAAFRQHLGVTPRAWRRASRIATHNDADTPTSLSD